MKEQLIQLAKQIGFKSNMLAFNLELLISTDKNEINRLYYYLWLCELQKWLREKYDFITWVECMYFDGFVYIPECEFKVLDFFDSVELCEEWELIFDVNHDTYESALEKVLFEALKLIK